MATQSGILPGESPWTEILDGLQSTGSHRVGHDLETKQQYANWVSLVAQMVKNLPTMQGTYVRALNQEDPLEKGMAIPSSILAWRIP